MTSSSSLVQIAETTSHEKHSKTPISDDESYCRAIRKLRIQSAEIPFSKIKSRTASKDMIWSF